MGAANQWFVSTGVVTGGMYASRVGCQPYVCPPCKKGLYPPSCPTDQCAPLLTCEKTCGNTAYPKDYSDDKTRLHQLSASGLCPKCSKCLAPTDLWQLPSQFMLTFQPIRLACTPTHLEGYWVAMPSPCKDGASKMV